MASHQPANVRLFGWSDDHDNPSNRRALLKRLKAVEDQRFSGDSRQGFRHQAAKSLAASCSRNHCPHTRTHLT
jgi:hypothetical protein